MKKKMQKMMVTVAALSVTVAMFTGCGSAKETETTATGTTAGETGKETTAGSEKETAKETEAEAAGKDKMIIATANEASNVTTYLHNAVAGDYLNRMTHNTLFYADENLVPQPDLVDSYEILSDTEWLFHLKKGVRFHNGMEMTAKDVKASLDLCKESPEVAQYGKSTGTVEVVDDNTVKITTDGPQSGLLTDLCHHGNAILPAELIESGHNFNKEPIGTGPYVMTAWNKGESLEYEAFPDYFKGEAPIKHIVWKIIPEGSSRTMALEAGEIDLVVEVEDNDVTRLKENDKIAVYEGAGTAHHFLMLNNEVAPFNNKDFRKALASAIDKEAVVKIAVNGGASVSNSMIAECFPGTTAEGAPTYDVEKAKEYMKSSGLKPEDCGFSMICSDDMKLRIGQVIQSSLKDNLNIDVELETMDLATYLDITATGKYEAAIGGYASGSLLSYSTGVFHSKSINASNKSRVNIPEVDEYIEKLQVTVDPEENEKIATEFNRLLNEECPQIPLFIRNNVRVYNAGIDGFNINSQGNTDYSKFSWK